MTKTELMGSTALIMTPAERAKGRFMRSPDGHDGGGAPAPAPAPAPEPAPAPLASDKEFVDTGPKETTAEDLEAEFGEVGDPASPPADEGDGEKPKPGASVEDRIAELTAETREAQRQAAEARREAAELRSQAEAAAPPKEAAGTDPDQAPDPAKYEFGEADARFIADTATFHARAEFQRQAQAAELKAQFATMEADWQTKLAAPEVIEKYPDFDTVVTKAADAGDWDCSPLMAIGIKQSPVGADVAYHLATNKADAARIARLTPIEQALEFGRLEGRYMHAPKAAAPEAVKTTSAPPPPAARARGAGGTFAVQADTEDFGAFDRMADGLLSKKK